MFKTTSSYKVYKSLGAVQGISTDNNEQYLVLDDKSKRITKELVCTGLSAKCAWVHYTAVFIPGITYPFGVCHMNDARLHNLQKAHIPVVLNKMGFLAMYTQAMVLGPQSYGKN